MRTVVAVAAGVTVAGEGEGSVTDAKVVSIEVGTTGVGEASGVALMLAVATGVEA